MYHLVVHNGKTIDGYYKQPHIIKSYPFKIQCLTWLYLHGYVYEGRRLKFIDSRFAILED